MVVNTTRGTHTPKRSSQKGGHRYIHIGTYVECTLPRHAGQVEAQTPDAGRRMARRTTATDTAKMYAQLTPLGTGWCRGRGRDYDGAYSRSPFDERDDANRRTRGEMRTAPPTCHPAGALFVDQRQSATHRPNKTLTHR